MVNTSQILDSKTKTRIKTGYAYALYAVIGFLAGIGGYLTAYGQNPLCEEFSEPECVQQKHCQAIYDQDMNFSRCVALTQGQQKALQDQKTVCRRTDGQWITLDFGSYCDCSQKNKIFTPENGCQ